MKNLLKYLNPAFHIRRIARQETKNQRPITLNIEKLIDKNIHVALPIVEGQHLPPRLDTELTQKVFQAVVKACTELEKSDKDTGASLSHQRVID